MVIVGTLVILAIGIFLIGDKEFLFSSTYRLQASFKNVTGLNNGAQVRVGGIHKGTVRQILLPTQPDGEMTVVMDLESSTRDVIKKDSRAAIQTEGLLGNKYVEISFGSNEAPQVKDGDAIGGVPPLDISDLMKKANEILDSTRESTDSLKDISSKINQGTGTMGALINDQEIYEQAKAGTAAFRENMEALKGNFLVRGFFNNRGYRDSSELTKHEISRLPAEPPIQNYVYDAKQIFDKPDTAKLKNQKSLHAAGQFLQGNSFGLAVVVARTGMKGDTDENRMLTQARAMVVRDYLADNFQLDDTRLKTIGLGESKVAVESSKIQILVYPAGTRAPRAAPASSRSPDGQSDPKSNGKVRP